MSAVPPFTSVAWAAQPVQERRPSDSGGNCLQVPPFTSTAWAASGRQTGVQVAHGGVPCHAGKRRRAVDDHDGVVSLRPPAIAGLPYGEPGAIVEQAENFALVAAGVPILCACLPVVRMVRDAVGAAVCEGGTRLDAAGVAGR